MAFDEVTSQPVWSPNSHYAKEMRKWEKPYRYEPFPKMIYKARRKVNEHDEPYGPLLVTDPKDEGFSARCQLIVGNEAELEKAKRDGWREGPKEALAYAQGLEDDIAKAAAHRHYEDRNLGERARAEAQAADEATAEHLPEIPEQPKKRRGRPPKPKPAA